MSKEERLQEEIKSLTAKIKDGKYTGEQYQLAVDMLKTKKDELKAIKSKNASTGPIINTPIVGLTTPEKKTSTKMAGGFRSMI